MNYEIFYFALVIILFILAISDLVVGVSNDAVNFLNAAVGSKASTIRVALIVASLGILVGATFSSGMMEVARSGIFHPQHFYFNEVMIIFVAVVITDVIILDVFNSLGMPTSTTVSMVFELLGASLAVAVVKIVNSTTGETLANLPDYINTSKASAIVFSILASVFIGFFVGMIVQFLARYIFSFKLGKTIKYFGSIWGGMCICLITYFILFKGMKGSSLIPEETFEWIVNNTWTLMLMIFAISTVLFQLILIIFKYNPLKIIVLTGTFALAMAFAGNDLVNFIGVSMAGLDSFEIFKASGEVSPTGLKMGALADQEAPVTIIILLGAGIIMILALWFSKKSRAVLKTTVDLCSKNTEEERFASTPLSRSIVKMGLSVGDGVSKVLPAGVKRNINRRFRPDKAQDQTVAFDLVRASVNLMVASALITFGTSLKLPLSTTYIIFMVAMGSSLSDGAWGRENAVYRVTGVFTVIAGWFMTALIAFISTALMALLFYYGSFIAMGAVILILAFSAIRSYLKSKKKELETCIDTNDFLTGSVESVNIKSAINQEIINLIKDIPNIYNNLLDGLEKENLKTLRKCNKDISAIFDRTQLMKNKVNNTLKLLQEDNVSGGLFYIQMVNYLRESLQSINLIIEGCIEHTNNQHKPLLKDQITELKEGAFALNTLYEHLVYICNSGHYDQLEELNIEQQKIHTIFDSFNKKQMKRVKSGVSGTKNSLLFLIITANTKNVALFTYLLGKSVRDFNTSNDND